MLTTVEIPTEVEVETTTITMEPTPLQQAILNMMEMVEKGHWCRNTTADGLGHACIVGLAGRVCDRW